MRIGYARCSTESQDLHYQIDALKAEGCELIFDDQGVSGVAKLRPGLEEALKVLTPDDTLVVVKLDRLARSMRELTDTVTDLHRRGIGFHSINEKIDLSSPYGEFVLHILAAVAQLEREMIRERTR